MSLREQLRRWPDIPFSIYASFAAFSTYSCVYAFRKAFAAASFADVPRYAVELSALDFSRSLEYKSLLVISQTIGYAMSKFIGIKVVSEMLSNRRAISIVLLVALAELALLGFALVPNSLRPCFLFLNGIPLGMLWGLVFSYLEGRRFTEIMGLGLCATFLYSSAMVKIVGKKLLDFGISEFWMPFVTGACFALPLLGSVWLLNQLPPPNEADEAFRTKRVPMNGRQRREFLWRLGPGLGMLVLIYLCLTSYRDFRDNFTRDIWDELRPGENFDFSRPDTIGSLVVLLLLMVLVVFRNNARALVANHLFIFAGCLTVGLSTYLFQRGVINDFTWMLCNGIGTYVGYIPFNAILYDRLIATFQQASNVGFSIYVADSIGYLASIGVLLYKQFGSGDLSWVQFLQQMSYVVAVAGGILTLGSLAYFWVKRPKNGQEGERPPAPSVPSARC